MTYKITIDKEKCIGCGACAAQCDNFEIEESKATVKKAEVEEPGCSQEMVDVCPVGAIGVEEK